METKPGERRLHPAWWTAILVAVIAALVVGTALAYSGTLKSYVPVTVASDRSGLVMESGAKVMLNGVQVGTITYSYRSMATTAEETLKALLEGGISEVELMGGPIT